MHSMNVWLSKEIAEMTNRMLDKDKFLLGTFTSNCSSGMTITKVPERWDAS